MKFKIYLTLATIFFSTAPAYALDSSVCELKGLYQNTNEVILRGNDLALDYTSDPALPEGILSTAEIADKVLSRSTTLNISSWIGDGQGDTNGSKFSVQIKLTNNFETQEVGFFADKVPDNWSQYFTAFGNRYFLSCKKKLN